MHKAELFKLRLRPKAVSYCCHHYGLTGLIYTTYKELGRFRLKALSHSLKSTYKEEQSSVERNIHQKQLLCNCRQYAENRVQFNKYSIIDKCAHKSIDIFADASILANRSAIGVNFSCFGRSGFSAAHLDRQVFRRIVFFMCLSFLDFLATIAELF